MSKVTLLSRAIDVVSTSIRNYKFLCSSRNDLISKDGRLKHVIIPEKSSYSLNISMKKRFFMNKNWHCKLFDA